MNAITIDYEALTELVMKIFRAAGAPVSVAKTVTAHLVTADCRGRESHGVSRVPRYVRQLQAKMIRPRAQMKILRDMGHSVEYGQGHAPTGLATIAAFAIPVSY